MELAMHHVIENDVWEHGIKDFSVEYTIRRGNRGAGQGILPADR
jgi:hypothetical protein